jgi:starch synthase
MRARSSPPSTGPGSNGVIASRRAELHGILNGIGAEEWNPATDRHLPARYRGEDLAGKAVCKRELHREVGLPTRSDAPLFGIISRLTPQKGLNILAQTKERLLGWNLQVVLLGSGDSDAERFFSTLSAARGETFRARNGFDNGLAHRIEAGCDFFLMPSRASSPAGSTRCAACATERRRSFMPPEASPTRS